MTRLTFEKLEKAFLLNNPNGFISRKSSNTVTVCFNYSADNIKTSYIARYNNIKEKDYNKYYNYIGSLLDIAEKLKLDNLVENHKNDTIYTMYKTPEKTQEQIEKEQVEFNELFGF